MVVVSAAGCERECRRNVRSAGFHCYQPTYREQIVRHGRKIWAELLFLGRYFFVRWPDGLSSPAELVDWRAIKAIRHVTDLFMEPPPADWPADVPFECPALVRDKEVERLRALEDRHGHIVLDDAMRSCLKKGQSVIALMGAFMGHQGLYIGTGRGGCEVAELELFGCKTKVEFAPGGLRAA